LVTTQTVTLLFTDLVRSTELSSSIGPEAANSVRREHFGLLRAAIDAAGGHEVKNLGDGLMVAFTSLSRALACAVAIQQGIERHNRRGTSVSLSIRIGLSTGEATEDQGDFFGEPVIEAARLCASAAGGQILATDTVKVLAGRHATQEFVSVGDLPLKGLPDPVPTVEVRWEPAPEGAGGQFSLPTRLVGASASSLFAFFGRGEELAHLAGAQKAVASEGRLEVVLVSGEPGIGKTTLVAQAARNAHRAGVNVLYGTCEEGIGIAYGPWIGVLSQLIEQIDEERLRDFVDVNDATLARLVPSLARRLSLEIPVAGSDPDAERFLLLEGASRLLALTSAGASLMVVLDDLHWADAASLQLLRHLVASALPMAVLVVGIFRESDLSRLHPLTSTLAELRREPTVTRLHLPGLEDSEIMDLLEAAAGHDLPEEGVALARALRRETGGNPFFLAEVIRHLAEVGAFAQDTEGHWVLSVDLDALALPSSVREVVAHRVARLGAETERALAIGAVIGREFDLSLLAGLLDLNEDRLIDLLEVAIGAGLVGESDGNGERYRFVHAIIQHTLYQDLSAARRQRAHQRVAEALERTEGKNDKSVADLARHWLAASRPNEMTKALHYASRAGELALAVCAPLDAIGWFTQALDLLDRYAPSDERGRATLLVGLGTAERQAGQPEHRATLRQAGRIARELDDGNLLVTVALAREPGAETMSEPDPERLALVETALRAVGTDDSAERARLLACLADETDPRDVSRRCALANEAVDVAHRLDDSSTLVHVVSLTMTALYTPDTLQRLLEETRAALALSEGMTDVSVRGSSLLDRAVACGHAADLAGHEACLTEMTAIAERTGLPLRRWQVLANRSWRSLLAGNIEAAEIYANQAFEIGSEMGLAVAFPTYGAQVWRIALERGRLADTIELLSQLVIDNPAMPGVRPALINAYCEIGRHDEAMTLFDAEYASAFADIPFDILWLASMAEFADSAADLGQGDAAALIYEKLLPYAGRFIFVGVFDYGFISRPLGRLATLLGRYDHAQRHLADAFGQHEALAAPYWTARTQLDQTELCLARQIGTDREAVHQLLPAVTTVATKHGYGGLLPRIEPLASRLSS
jgi:class 3 adenylate cyclase/tetratricopeptide (TPR) repeat protein